MIGRKIDRYEILAKLGEGGMGSVWRARHPVLERDVALKILPQSLAQSEEARQRLLREAKTASILTHPSIAGVHDAGETGDNLYIVFSLVEGRTVTETCREASLEPSRAVRLCREAAEALAHAHGRGVLHRDITGRNVMITEDDHAMIVDFGLAVVEDQTRLTLDASPMGTASYIAPEVARGQQGDARADVYGLGVVLYEMLTGRVPFEGQRTEALLYAAAHEEPIRPSDRVDGIDPLLDAVVLKALAKDPHARFASAEDLAAALRALEEGHLQVARSLIGAPRRPARRWISSRRVGLPLGALAVVVALVLTLRPGPFSGIGTSPRYRSAAILPLTVDEGDLATGRTIASAICEHLANKLTLATDVKILPWLTSSRYPADAVPLAERAKELGVEVLILGSFAADGDRIHGSFLLVGAEGFQIWTHPFDTTRLALQNLQQEVLASLADRLQGRLSVQQRQVVQRPMTNSGAAYDFYLKGAHAQREQTPESVERATEYFHKALELDPGMAEAHVGLGAVYSARAWRGWHGGERSLDLAEQHFRRALELDPKLLSAHRGLIILAFVRGKNEECLRIGELVAATGREDVEAIFAMGMAYHFGGLPERAVLFYQRTLELDPNNAGAYFYLGSAYSWTDDLEKAVEYGEAYLKRFGDDHEVRLWIATSLHDQGRLRLARGQYERSLKLAGASPHMEAYLGAVRLYQDLGDTKRAVQLAQSGLDLFEGRLRTSPESTWLHTTIALLHALMGHRDEFERHLALAPFDGYMASSAWTGYAVLGDFAMARQVLRRAWELGMFLPTSLTEIRMRYAKEMGELLSEGEAIRADRSSRYQFGLELIRGVVN